MAFAEHDFALSERQDDGCTLREHLLEVERIMGETPPELIGPELPDCCDHLWRWFHDIGLGRQSGPFGPMPLSSLEIASWCWLTGTRLQAWELDAIRRLDVAFLANAFGQPKKKPNSTPPDAEVCP